MKDQTILYVEKDTDLMRSTFVALGLADLFYRLPEPNSGVDVRIRDVGSAYVLEVGMSRDDMLRRVQELGALPPLLPVLLKKPTGKEQKQMDAGASLDSIRRKYFPEGFPGEWFDYEQERQKVQADRAARKEQREGDVVTRDPRFSLWAHLISSFNRGTIMRVGYPLMLHVWHSHSGEQAVALCDAILLAYGEYPNRLAETEEAWGEHIKPAVQYPDFGLFGWDGSQTKVSTLSLVSPSTAQGSWTSTSLRSVNTTIPKTFWLEFYLAMAGYMVAGMPYRSGDDALLYYPLPNNILISRLRALMGEYRGAKLARDLYDYSGVMPRAKVDALCQIGYYLKMVEHYAANPPERRRTNAISGLVGYYYKNLTGHTPFDETVFSLPGWMPEKVDRKGLERAGEVLEAHQSLIRALRNDYAEELTILDYYRRFIALGDPDDWIAFAIAYGNHRFSKLPDNPWLPALPINTLEETLMNAERRDYRPVLENEGFKNVSRAIRSCTVQLRYWKDVKNSQTAFKVRHGLGDDLRRRAHNPDQFIEDLSEFVYDYTRESSSVQANTGETRPFITEEDLYEVVAMVNEYGSRVVANLLVAAGYSSDFSRREQKA